MNLQGSIVIVDYVAAKTLLSTGTLAAKESGLINAEGFVLPGTEYTFLYSRALGSNLICPSKYHSIAGLLGKSCECLQGWIPLLSTSFIGALGKPSLRILQQPSAAIALRLWLKKTFSELGDRDCALLTGGILTSYPTLVCTASLSPAYVTAALHLGLAFMELDHTECSAT